jgi:F-type H+-transporting ATPase subunit gamma
VPLAKIQEDQQTTIENLVDYLEDLYNKHEFDYADIAYTYFKNTLTHSVTIEGILPLNRLITSAEEEKNVYEFEPSLEEIASPFLQEYFKIHLTRLLYESFTSENAARMTAMDNASRNAQKMINQLTLIYNRTRQAHITTEITEIISGAEAV